MGYFINGKMPDLTLPRRRREERTSLETRAPALESHPRGALVHLRTRVAYVALLPGETKTVSVRYPAAVTSPAALRLRGWNVAPAEVKASR